MAGADLSEQKGKLDRQLFKQARLRLKRASKTKAEERLRSLSAIKGEAHKIPLRLGSTDGRGRRASAVLAATSHTRGSWTPDRPAGLTMKKIYALRESCEWSIAEEGA